MSNPKDYEMVAQKAHALLGPYADFWLTKPNRSFAQLTPYEMAQTNQGAQLVLAELERTVLVE